MESTIRTEFEEYIQKLIETISRDIFLEDLKHICEAYQEQLAQYQMAMRENREVNYRLQEDAGTNNAEVRKLNLQVQQQLEQLNQSIELLNQDYERLFQQFSDRVSALNATEREAFVKKISHELENSGVELTSRIVDNCHVIFQQFLQDLAEVQLKNEEQYQLYEQLVNQSQTANTQLALQLGQAAEEIQGLKLTAGKQLDGIQKTVQGITEEYAKVFQGFAKNVSALNTEERGKLTTELDKLFSTYRSSFAEEIARKYEHIAENFRQDLTAVYEEYYGQLDGYRQTFQEAKEDSSRLKEITEQSMQNMQQWETKLDNRLQELNHSIDGIMEGYAEVFEGFSMNVTSLNQQERERLSQELKELLESYRSTFAQEIAGKYQHIAEVFRKDLTSVYEEYYSQLKDYRRLFEETKSDNAQMKQHTAEHLQNMKQWKGELDNRLKSLNGTIAGITERYANEFQGYAKDVATLNEQEREKFKREVQELISNSTSDLEEENARLRKYADESLQKLQQWGEEISQGVKELNATAADMAENNLRGGQDFLVKTATLNERQKRELVQKLEEGSQQQQQLLEQGNRQQQQLLEQIHSQQQQLLESVKEEQQQHIQELGSSQQKLLEEISQQELQRMEALFREKLLEQQKQQQNVMEELRRELEDWQDKYEEKLAEQKKYILMDIQMIQELDAQLKDEKENQIQRQDEAFQAMIASWKEMQQAEEKHVNAIGWKLYMTVSSAMSVLLLVLLFIMIKPWDILGIPATLAVVAVFLLCGLLIAFRKPLIKAILQSRKEKQETK